MKHLFLTALLALSATASATPESYGKIATFIQNQLAGKRGVDLKGKTPEGKACALFLTDRDGGDYYVVVGLNEGKVRKNDYIGMLATPEDNGDMQVVDGLATLVKRDSWGNDSMINIVKIRMLGGSAVYAEGVSDIQTIKCMLDGSRSERN